MAHIHNADHDSDDLHHKEELTVKLAEQYSNIINLLGEDNEREGLVKTPQRVAKAMQYLTRGYHINPEEILLSAMFREDYQQMVVVKDIEVYSMCEHHMLPFFGKYYFAYIPNPKGKILGLSKVARVVDYHSAKLQIQERLCSDIVEDLEHALDCEYPPIAFGIIIKAEHLCKSMRGVKKKGLMTTAYLKGTFKTDINCKNELMQHIK